MTLVVFSLPVLFEPIHKIDERSQVFLMEEETSRLNLDEFPYHFVFWNVGKNNMLMILRKDCKLVRDAWSVGIFLAF